MPSRWFIELLPTALVMVGKWRFAVARNGFLHARITSRVGLKAKLAERDFQFSGNVAPKRTSLASINSCTRTKEKGPSEKGPFQDGEFFYFALLIAAFASRIARHTALLVVRMERVALVG